MTPPLSPFDLLLAQLSQAMSVIGSTPVVNDLGWQNDAQHTTADRLAWIPTGIAAELQPFEVPMQVTPFRQACDFDVSVYGSSYARVLELHSYLVGWLDLLVGPPQGCAPSDDAAPAVLRGVTDLSALSYPFAGLEGLHLDVTVPFSRQLSFGASPFASPQSIASAIGVAARAAGLQVLARLRRETAGAIYLELVLETDPLGIAGATLTVNPTISGSACAALGFSSADANLSATGSPSKYPYRPGYVVKPTAPPGPRGGDLKAHGWGAIVPVRLYRPIASMQFLTGVFAEAPIQVIAEGGDSPPEVVIDTP